jgi:hypothetical protein
LCEENHEKITILHLERYVTSPKVESEIVVLKSKKDEE